MSQRTCRSPLSTNESHHTVVHLTTALFEKRPNKVTIQVINPHRAQQQNCSVHQELQLMFPAAQLLRHDLLDVGDAATTTASQLWYIIIFAWTVIVVDACWCSREYSDLSLATDRNSVPLGKTSYMSQMGVAYQHCWGVPAALNQLRPQGTGKHPRASASSSVKQIPVRSSLQLQLLSCISQIWLPVDSKSTEIHRSAALSPSCIHAICFIHAFNRLYT